MAESDGKTLVVAFVDAGTFHQFLYDYADAGTNSTELWQA
jgi:hypothetical protein